MVMAMYATNQRDALRAENANLKAEVTATRSAIDAAAAFAEQHDGRIVVYSAPTLDISSSPRESLSGDTIPVSAISIRIEARHHDYPSKEFVVGPAGSVRDITYNDDGTIISNHAGDWGTMSKWRR